ncbi:MAG: glutathione S-transferase family protein [Hyphomonadaceae bacterium]
MIIVHHLNNSRSQRVLWLLEELGLPYEIAFYQRDPVTNLAPPELKKVHPLGKSPVIVDNGRVIAESGAILDYLARWHGATMVSVSPDDPDWPAYLHWMHFAEGSAMLPLMLQLYAGRLGEAAAPLKPRIQSEIANHLAYMNAALEGRDYLVSDHLTAADVQNSFILEAANRNGQLDAYPNLVRVLAAWQARPAYRRALEKGGPYALGPKDQ